MMEEPTWVSYDQATKWRRHEIANCVKRWLTWIWRKKITVVVHLFCSSVYSDTQTYSSIFDESNVSVDDNTALNN